jgi:hypothetical protein
MVLLDRTSCVAQIEGKIGTYGYQPSLGAGITFCVLFGGSMLGHAFVSFRYRTWWQIVFSIGALSENSLKLYFTQSVTNTFPAELIGWAGPAHMKTIRS